MNRKLNVPELIPVSAGLERVETRLQDDSPVVNIDRTIKANELIQKAVASILIDLQNPVLESIVLSKLNEINETLGEQRLSRELLRVLELTNGDKSLAAQWIAERVDSSNNNF